MSNGSMGNGGPAEIDHSKLVEIPQPPEHLFGLLGNLPDVEPAFPVRSYWHMMDLYGPIFKLKLGSKTRVFVGTQALTDEICRDEERYIKIPPATLQELRALTGDGLFTAFIEEKNWWKAHRLLVPAFGPLGLRKMFDNMLDISSQLVLKWDREGPDHEIDAADDLTRLAFDTIGLCAFSYRFNQFYSDQAHPFAQQMAAVLLESGKRSLRTGIQNRLYYKSEQERQDNVRKMAALCDQIVADRREHPQPDNNDLLSTMMNGVDKETGETLSDEHIRYQMATFLVAGHETTSATLAFAYYNLCKHPEKLHKAQQQVDDVVGSNVLTVDMLPKLSYVDAVIKETLRLNPPITWLLLTSTKDQVLAGKYFMPKGDEACVLFKHLHTDRKAWGDDVEEFRPERMLDGGFQRLPPNSWNPFGNGMRACIGRGFAEQEMLMNIALVLQKFQLQMADPQYDLKLKSNLTIKPEDFKFKVRRRPGKSLLTGIPGGVPAQAAEKHKAQHAKVDQGAQNGTDTKSLTVFFGGNTGTCESMAQALVDSGANYGLSFDVQPLDAATENLPADEPCVIITASYEGKPPDNAKKFVSWLEHLDNGQKSLKTKYAVFGVGNSDWASTYHRIPKLVDELLSGHGATKIIGSGFSNVKEDLIGPWEEWSENLLQELSGSKGSGPSDAGVEVSIEPSSLPKTLGGDEMDVATVIFNNELADASAGASKRHLAVRLHDEVTYAAGDYLVVQARNPEDNVRRILERFGLSESDKMAVKESKKKHLPSEPTSVFDFLETAVELALPITKRQLGVLASYSKDNTEERKKLEAMQGDAEYQDILSKRFSVLDILEDLPSLEVPFGVFIDMLQPLTPRQYSISSSSLHPANKSSSDREAADLATITYDVQTAPAWSGHGTYSGVASTYLATRRVGDKISCFVRSTNVGFRLPSDTTTPVIMIAAGTGIAPMRAFLQERAAIRDAGVKTLGPALLFFGCRHEDKDYIHKSELEQWEQQGIVKLCPAFSRPDSGKGKYVHEVLEECGDEVAELFSSGGKIYLCGSAARLGKSTAETCKTIYRQRTGKSAEEAEEWLETVKTNRYVSDVY